MMLRAAGRFVLPLALALVVGAPAARAQSGEHAYIGAAKCKKCHLKQYRSWSETKMAKAFESLKPGVAAERKSEVGLDPDKDYTSDAECLRCHVTGYGKPGGFSDLASTPKLAGVGCEMCHGAGGTYAQDQYMSLKNKQYKKADIVAVGMVAEVTAEQCVACHNDESPFTEKGATFDFEANKEKGTHEHFALKYPH